MTTRQITARPGSARPAIGRIAAKGLWRELQSGMLTTMLAALIVAVAAVTAVGFFTDRVDAGMRAQAAEFLAADGRIDAPDPLDQVRETAQGLGITTADTLTFPTVVLANNRPLLVSLKAVGPGYPLRGNLQIAPAVAPATVPASAPSNGSVDSGNQEIDAETVDHGPAPGTVWLAPRALALLDLKPGDPLQIGQKTFTIAARLLREPDVGNVFAQAAPRAMIALADIPATGLVTPASRVRYHLLLAAPAAQRDALFAKLKAKLPKDRTIERPENSQPAFKTAFDRAARFLGLAAMVAVLLAGAALLLAARHYNAVQQDSAALMRAFGASRRTIGRIYALRLLMLALLATVPGVLIGAVTQQGLAALMRHALAVALPPPGLLPVFIGLGIALIALIGFALPALIRLQDTPPLRVLNRQLAAPPPAAAVLFGFGLVAMGLLVWLQARDLTLTAYVLGGMGASLLVFLGLAWLLIRGLRRLRVQGVARFGLARLAREPLAGSIQIAALALGLTALLLLGVVRGDLLDAWHDQIPVDAPNFFAINIQPDQVADLKAFLQAHRIHGAGFYPMVRARWTAENGKTIHPETYQGQARRLAEREFNLSTTPTLTSDNKIVAGQWPDKGWSVEQGIADTFHWKLGDTLTFQVNGSPVTAAITSIRKVNWDSMRPNFFVLAPKAPLAQAPAQYVTSFYLPQPNIPQQTALLRTFPTLTLFDLGRILAEVRSLIDRASQAVQYVFLFTLAAGLIVLIAAFHASEAARLRETAILRVLGARRGQIMQALWLEFTVIGLLVGLLAAIAAGGLGAVLAWKLFDLSWQIDLRLPVYGLAAGWLLALLLVPWLGARITRASPISALRR